jgi:hypothetical protein
MTTRPALARRGIIVASLFLLFLKTTAISNAVIINFESLSDSTSVGTTYAGLGVTFNGATVLTSGISLNELDFPPHSGVNVAFDDGGPITGTFGTAVNSISVYITYSHAVTLLGFDAFGTQIAVNISSFGDNTVSSGESPNELISISSATDIKSFTLLGDSLGGSFTVDDFSFSANTTSSIPDLNSAPLLLICSLWTALILTKSVYNRKTTRKLACPW